MNGTPVAQKRRTRIEKWDYIKFKSFCAGKEKTTRMKRYPTEW
jgi:hypothetical protein